MHPRPAHDLIQTLRRALLCAIVVALAMQGSTSVLVQLLGPAHRHDLVSRAALPDLFDQIGRLWRDLGAWHAEVRRQLPLSGHPSAAHGPRPARSADEGHDHDHAAPGVAAATNVHDHAGYLRHHHRAGDASVIAVDATGGDAAEAAAQSAAGSITLPLAPPLAWVLPAPPWRLSAWPHAPPGRWADAPTRATERPPRA